MLIGEHPLTLRQVWRLDRRKREEELAEAIGLALKIAPFYAAASFLIFTVSGIAVIAGMYTEESVGSLILFWGSLITVPSILLALLGAVGLVAASVYRAISFWLTQRRCVKGGHRELPPWDRCACHQHKSGLGRETQPAQPVA